MRNKFVSLFGIFCYASCAFAWVSSYENKIRRFSNSFRGDADWEWASGSNNNPQFWNQNGNVNNWQQPTGQSSNKGVTQSWPSQSKDDDIPDTWQEWNPQQPKNVKGSDYGGDDEPTEGRLEDILKGVPGEDFPNFDSIPDTDFDCGEQETRGYYGDVGAGCQVFHICQPEGRKDSFLCPVGTIFNQKYFVCDWWFNVNCSDTPSYYDINAEVYKEEEPKEVVVMPPVTTAKPVVKPPPTSRGKSGGGPSIAPSKPPTGGPQRPPPSWTTKGSSSSSWGQSTSSQGTSASASWGKSSAWKKAEANGDSNWSGGNGNGGKSKSYGTSSTRSKAGRGKNNGSTVRLSNIKQIKNQAWISVGSSNLQTQNKPGPHQAKVSKSGYNFLTSFGARMKPSNLRRGTVAPGIWTPRSSSTLEPTALRRGIDRSRYSETHEGWFGNSNIPRNQKPLTNTQATSIVPTEVKGVWEQESLREPWHQTDDFNDDYDIDSRRNSLYDKRDDDEYSDASTPGHEYVNGERRWKSIHKGPLTDRNDLNTETNRPEIHLLGKYEQPFERRSSDAYKYEYSSPGTTRGFSNPTTTPSSTNANNKQLLTPLKLSTESYVPFGRRIHYKHAT